ncbi:MAG: carbohydrate binding domain-containing protein [Pirellulales bacterium]
MSWNRAGRWWNWASWCGLVLSCGGTADRLAAAEPAPRIPFVLPWNAAGPAAFDESPGRDARPIDAAQRLQVTPDGHLAAAGSRVRLWGVNVCFGANFPAADDARQIAARLAHFRLNAVRFHHMDSARYPSGILKPGQRTTRTLHPEALDRLHRFVHELSRHGIYSNINLLVGRHFSADDGLPAAIDRLPPKQQHLVGFFSDDLIRLQQEYARQLLTAPNPYAGQPLASDPAVALVEIHNENGLVHGWLSGDLDDLPEPFASRLQQRWNDWLGQRYDDTAALRRAWRHRDDPLGDELLRNGRLNDQLAGWNLERHAGAQATARVEADGAGRGTPAVRLEVTERGSEPWHVQFHQPGLAVRAEQLYTLTLRARSDRPRTLQLRLGQAHAPWEGLGFEASLALTPEWRDFTFTFQPRVTDDNARVGLSDLGRELGTCWFAQWSLRPGGRLGLAADERLETRTIPPLRQAGLGAGTRESRRDWIAFLRDVEQDYWRRMRQFLRDELHVQALLVGTILGCSPTTVQAEFDVVDSHAYWHHPQFPGRPWDPDNWLVENTSMVNTAPGTLGRLASQHVRGKPQLVTEYNHAAPNEFSSEAPLFIAAYAALQDWDGVFLFAYSHRANDWNSQAFTSFFDIDQHPLKMANVLPGAALFRRADVRPAATTLWAPLDATRELDLLTDHGQAWRLVDAETAGVPAREALTRRIGWQTSPSDRTAPASSRSAAAVPSAPQLANTPETDVVWDTSRPQRGVVTVNTPRSKLVMGYVDGRSFTLGEIRVTPGSTFHDWCTLALTRLDPGSWEQPGRALITVTATAENADMHWTDATHRSVGRQWGKAPSRIEVVPALVEWPVAAERIVAWALDERGQPTTRIEVTDAGPGRSRLTLGPPAKTLWYLVETR